MTLRSLYLIYHASNALTTVVTLSYFKFGYFWPTPTNKIGFEVEYTRERAVPTLSSTVSNLDRRIASIYGEKLSLAYYWRALLNFVIWSTASLPTSASPMKTTKLGLFNLTSRANYFMSGVLSCILPAVSTKTASILFFVA